MTEHRNDNHDDKRGGERAERLDALYREAGDVEPEAGLDRIIRARADEAAGSHRSSSRLPWLGGLVTASVAIVAIAVVLQQSPPGQPAQDSFAPLEESEPEAYMSPSMGAQSQPRVSADAGRARSQSSGKGDSARRTFRDQARESLPEVAPETRQQGAAHPEAEPVSPSPDPDDSTLQRVVVSESRINAADRAAFESESTLIEKLRELIEAERIDEARRLVDEAAGLDPELDLPNDIKRALRRPDPERPDSDPNSENP